MLIGLVATLALLLDRIFGEPPSRYHPLVYFGKWADFIERSFRRLISDRICSMHGVGVFALLVALLPPVCAVIWLSSWDGLDVILAVLCGYLAIGLRSLQEHAEQISHALFAHNLPRARDRLSHIVSRDVSEADTRQISTATIESVLENGNDAVFAALFWLALAGAPGVVLYRLANTLDAMWGYRNVQYLEFGWAAARLDDIMGYIPARLTAFSYAIAGHSRCAWRAYREQGRLWYSPNAGPVMASGAGALRIIIGGVAKYDGQLKSRPYLGYGDTAQPGDITRAIRLVQISTLYWVMGLIAVTFLLRLFFLSDTSF